MTLDPNRKTQGRFNLDSAINSEYTTDRDQADQNSTFVHNFTKTIKQSDT